MAQGLISCFCIFQIPGMNNVLALSLSPKTLFSASGLYPAWEPVENGYIESFNGKLH